MIFYHGLFFLYNFEEINLIMQNILLFISGGEIIFILLIIVVLFGSKRLPEIARGLGKGIKQFKDAANDIKHEMTKENQEMVDDLKQIKKNTDKLKDNVTKYKIFEKDN